jgi:hypothetical protein
MNVQSAFMTVIRCQNGCQIEKATAETPEE